MPAEGGRFVLPLEAGFLALEGAGDTWAVVERQRGQDPTVLASGLDLGYAQGFAEDRARQAGAGALIKADAPWRAQPATERQRAALGRWRIPVAEGLTRGEASDLITAAMAAKG